MVNDLRETSQNLEIHWLITIKKPFIWNFVNFGKKSTDNFFYSTNLSLLRVGELTVMKFDVFGDWLVWLKFSEVKQGSQFLFAVGTMAKFVSEIVLKKEGLFEEESFLCVGG